MDNIRLVSKSIFQDVIISRKTASDVSQLFLDNRKSKMFEDFKRFAILLTACKPDTVQIAFTADTKQKLKNICGNMIALTFFMDVKSA